MEIASNLNSIKKEIPSNVELVAVSKTKPVELVQEAYNAGHRVFGENKVQELVDKFTALPKDIYWHFIGHLQTNKVKQIAPFVHLIHAVDSEKLLAEINKRALQNNRVINCLLQIKIAEEESKFGLSQKDAEHLLQKGDDYPNVNVCGLMGMATNTHDTEIVENEFKLLAAFYKGCQNNYPQLKTLSMGMSGDFPIAIKTGSNMVRVGSSIFGARNY